MPIEFTTIGIEELKQRFLAAATGDTVPAHVFFESFEFISYYMKQDYLGCLQLAIEILSLLKDLDAGAYANIHKGYIFYFAAISSFKLHDFESGAFFFDAAASEDLRNDPNPESPARLFMLLNTTNQNQAAIEQTKDASFWLNLAIAEYALFPGLPSLTFDDIQNHFLRRAITDHPEWRTLVTSTITFFMEWGYLTRLLNVRIENGTWEPFYLHLLKGCLLLESLFKANPTIAVPESTLGSILNGAVRTQLGFSPYTGGTFTLSDVLHDLPNVAFNIESHIKFVTKLRNTVGHNLAWDTPITKDEYASLLRMISNSCLHVISTLYR